MHARWAGARHRVPLPAAGERQASVARAPRLPHAGALEAPRRPASLHRGRRQLRLHQRARLRPARHGLWRRVRHLRGHRGAAPRCDALAGRQHLPARARLGQPSGYLHRYTHTRSMPELQPLLRTASHYAIWDDHDFGPNDADGSWIHADLALECFDLFWPNPTCGAPGVKGAITAFSYGDVDFFLLDDRTYRTRAGLKTAPAAMLGAAQLDWLIRALKYSDAPFKLVAVGSQVLNSAAVHETYATLPQERAELLRRIEEEGIAGVVFLTGDRHHTVLSALQLKDGRTLYDLTSSPLTSGVHGPKEDNAHRVEGTLVEQRGFATLSFTGKRKERVMTMRAHDAEGRVLWERVVAQEKRP
ncbi:MAG: alkaline phosphatase D family protein [Flavobacteriales bacterium]